MELFWPKQDSVAVIENLWHETQGPNRRWNRTYVLSSAFLSVTRLFDYLRKIFKDKIDITYDEYKQMVIFHVQCSLAAPILVNGIFCNCLRTVEMNNEEYKYLPASFCSQTYPLCTSKSDIISRYSF